MENHTNPYFNFNANSTGNFTYRKIYGSSTSSPDYVSGSLNTGLSILSFGGNFLVIFVVLRKRVTSGKLLYTLLLTLAWADLLVALTTLLPAGIYHFQGQFTLGTVICKITNWSRSVLANSSVFILVTIAVDRFRNTVWWNKSPISLRSMRIWLGIVWGYNMAISSPYLVWSHVLVAGPVKRCHMYFPPDSSVDALIIVTRTMNFFLPLFVMWVCYIGIAWTVFKSKQRVEQHTMRDGQRSLDRKWNKRIIKMCVLIAALYTVCWTPFQVATVYGRFADVPAAYFPHVLGKTYLLTAVQSCLNPFVYGVMWNNFRTYAKQVFTCNCGKATASVSETRN